MSLMRLPTPPIDKPTGRIHRLRDDDEPNHHPTKPAVTPFTAADGEGNLITAKGEPMPRGVYDRSKAKPRAAANDAPEAAQEPRKRGPKGRAAKKTGHTPRDVLNGPALIVQGDTVLINGLDDAQLAKLIAFYRSL